jgi:hypothetical protein
VTITLPGILLVGAVFLLVCAVYGGITVWRRRIPGAPLGVTIRVGVYLSRYALALEYYGLRQREIRAHIDTLRGDLGSVDDLVGALRRFGPPRTLAAAVTDGMLRPSLLRGSIGFAVGIVASMTMGIAITEVFLAGVEAVGEPGDAASWSALGLFDVDVSLGTDGQVSTIGFGGLALLVIPILGALIGGRVWRWRLGRSSRSVASAG